MAPLDFASALYLGMRHPSAELGPWPSLTSGKPAALHHSPRATLLAERAAALQGCEAALLAPSTLHLAIDVLDYLRPGHTLIADAALYPVLRWGLERAAGMGAIVRLFRHGDHAQAIALIRQAPRHRPPAVLCDATDHCGRPQALSPLLAAIQARHGVLVVDQTQALGLLGHHPAAARPWGHGGGGLLRWAGLSAQAPVLLVASWAKAFGAPLATLAGPAALVSAIAAQGPTQDHCSTLSAAAIEAGLHALDYNRRNGASLRARLLRNLQLWQRALIELAHAGLQLAPRWSWQPMQQLWLRTPALTRALYQALRLQGLQCALLRRGQNDASIAVILRSDHAPMQINALCTALQTLSYQLRPSRAPRPRRKPGLNKEQHHV